MLLLYHLIALLFIEDGHTRSLSEAERSEEGLVPEGNAVRSMLMSPVEVSFESDPAVPSGPNADNLRFKDDIGNEKILREIFLTCAERNNSIPFLTSKFDFDCYSIGERGPCSGEDEWLVVREEDEEEDGRVFPWSTCAQNPCHAFEGRVYYKEDCIETSAASLVCNKGMELELDIDGRGVCHCSEGLLTVYDEQGYPHCHQEFLQGPCKEGQQLVRGSDVPACVPTDCKHRNQTRWSTGECLESVHCGEEGVVVFNEGKLDCAVAIRQLINVPSICEDGEAKDATGDCQRVYENLGRTSRSPSGGKVNFSRNTLKRLMCSKHPNKFNC